MDTSVLPQDQSLSQKSARESSLLSVTKMPIPRRRATVLWDKSLEDVVEDDEMEEEHNMSREESVQKYEENKVLVGKEEYMVCARATLRLSVAWSLEARYSCPSFPHLSPIFIFFMVTLFFILPISSIKN